MELPEIDTQEGTNIEEPSQLPGFVVVGEKKGVDPIEEFWMQKLTKVEEQYEEHITKLERALLEKRISRRVVCRQGEQLTKIKEQFHTKKKESEKLLKQSSKFQHELSEQRKEVNMRFYTIPTLSSFYCIFFCYRMPNWRTDYRNLSQNIWKRIKKGRLIAPKSVNATIKCYPSAGS